ncbi:MAG: hypothetical protein D6813_03495 [Calditrichaeota bacterium]|nr:MAG: hypothetical protein D6813_03495 [Calditrichota bacterium]
MNVCREFREHIFEILSGEFSGEKQPGYLNHWTQCPLCQEELKIARKVWNALNHYHEVEVPKWLREKTVTRVYDEAQKEEAQAAQLVLRWGRLSFGKVLGAIASGVSLSLVFILMLGQKVKTQPLSSEQLLVLGTLWSGFLIAGFCLLLGKFQIKNFKLSAISSFAIVATFFVMLGTYLCPDKTVYGWWKLTYFGSRIYDKVGEVGSCFIFGIFYVLPIAFLISPVIKDKFKGALLNNSLLTATVYVLLLIPAIYIQCAYLGKGIMMSWIMGSFVGALSGILGGASILHLKQRLSLK